MSETRQVFGFIHKGDTDGLRELLARDPAAASARDANGVSALLQAAYRRQDELVRMLREAAGELDLFEAAALGEIERLRTLLAEQPDRATAWSGDGFTPLHLACFFGQPQAVELLLKSGAKTDDESRNPARLHPINSAAAARNARAVALLLEHGANVNAAQNGGYTALHSAAHNGDVETVKLLLEKGADPSLTSDDGRTPLEMARLDNHTEVIALLS
jgi:ankyrin repeat protein